MHVLMLSRKDILKNHGGDTVQIKKVIQLLKERNCVDVELLSEVSEEEIKRYDLVHFFGIYLIDEIFDYMKLCLINKVPFALSPVYWNSKEYDMLGQPGWRRYAYRLLGEEGVYKLKRLRDNFELSKVLQSSLWSKRKAFLENANLVLPNAEEEMKKIISEFELAAEIPYLVVPNAVDKVFLDKEFNEEQIRQTRLELFGSEKDFVLCVANFNPRKNQIRLVEATKKLNIPLLLIGSGPDAEFNKIKEASTDDPNIRICKFVAQAELIKYYQAAKVHILPSWFDTPGLASLEAAACGCNIVVSNRGSTYEYFGDYASYCEPGSVDSISRALEKEYSASRGKPGLKERIMENYLWEHAARMTYEGYERVLLSR